MPPIQPTSSLPPSTKMTQVTMWDDKIHKMVKAEHVGPVCIHADILLPDHWTVTHTHTGLYIVRPIKTRPDAVLIANTLITRASTCFSQREVRQLMKTLPDWVYRWCLACRKEQGYVHFVPYLKGEK